MVGAQARELARVRVSFDRPVKQDDPGVSGDALAAARYAITRLSGPAVEAAVVSVEAVTSSAVDLLTEVPLTPGASYRIDVDGLVDASGHAIETPDVSAIFTGFVPPRPGGRGFDLYRFLPEWSTSAAS